MLGIGKIVDGVVKIADDLTTTDEERLKIALREKEIDADLIKGQQEVNKYEAQHKSLFVAGWRPFIGWVGGLALAYQFIIYPLLVWGWQLFIANGWLPEGTEYPPVFETGPLLTIVLGMLGIGGMRSFDKLKGTATEAIGKRM